MVQFPTKAKQIIIREIPDELIKERSGGGKKVLQYLSGNTVIDLLNQSFNYLWDWEQLDQWIEASQDKFNPKYDKEPVPQGPVAHVKGRLTVHFPLGDDSSSVFSITKTGYGSKTVLGGQSDQEHVFKAAGTDALKKAASLLGIGLELYRDEDEQYFFNEQNYEDPWTDEMVEEFKEQREFIRSFMEDYNFGVDDMAYYYHTFSNGEFETIDYIVPDNISSFVEFLNEQINESQEESSEE